jgi:5-methylcytosine-specific restriction endonuclease McrA
VPLSEGGTEDDSNLQTLLIECHKRKTKRENAEIGASLRW